MRLHRRPALAAFPEFTAENGVSRSARAVRKGSSMMTKTIALLSLLAVLAGAYVVNAAPAKTPVVTIEDVESYAADDVAECEYIATPTSMKVLKGGPNC